MRVVVTGGVLAGAVVALLMVASCAGAKPAAEGAARPATVAPPPVSSAGAGGAGGAVGAGFVARSQTTVDAGNPATAVVARQPWKFEDREGDAIFTRTYSIYTTEKTAMIQGRLPGFMEAALEAYTTLMGPLPRPTTRMECFVMGSRPQWQRLTLYMLGERGKNLINIERGGFAIGGRAYLFDIGATDTMAIASHEGWHQFSQNTFGDRLPVWLEEGIASYFEGHRWSGNDVTFLPWFNIERFDRLREAASKRQLLPFDEVLTMVPDRLVTRTNDVAVTYYAQLWALVHFLAEGDGGRFRPGLRALVSDAAGGRMSGRLIAASGGRGSAVLAGQRMTPVLIREYFGLEVDQLAERHEVFIRQLVAPGARNAIVEGRSPLTGEPGVWPVSGAAGR